MTCAVENKENKGNEDKQNRGRREEYENNNRRRRNRTGHRILLLGKPDTCISSDEKCHKEIKKWIAMEKEAFTKREELLKGRLNRDIKKRMVKALIWSVTLYGAETWTMRKEDVKRIEACEMWIWRSMERISWTEHRTNEEVLKKVEEKRSQLRL